jgi:hypothetical protein
MKITTRVRISLLMAFTALCQSLSVSAAELIRVETGKDVDWKVFSEGLLEILCALASPVRTSADLR